MNEAAAALFDYTDFTSFSKVNTDTKTNNCRIMQARWTELARANGVLKSRRTVFCATWCVPSSVRSSRWGGGKLTPEGFRAGDRRKKTVAGAGESMPGNALFLVDVAYPDKCFMVKNRNGKEKEICG